MQPPAPLVLPVSAAPVDTAHGSVFFVGTATVLIRYAGFTVLTDPNFLHRGERVHLGYGLHATRLTDPAIELDALPPLDLVVLSHMHGDHFDQVVSERLDHSVPIVTTAQAAGVLDRRGFQRTHSLQTWQRFEARKGSARLRITAAPGRHGPGPLAYVLPPVMGSVLEFEATPGIVAFRIYITGDTLMYDEIREIPRRFPDIDLALLHLGGTRVLGVMVTMDDQQGLAMMRTAHARTNIPIHYNDYDRFRSPLEAFQRAVAAEHLEESVHYLHHGEQFDFDVPPARRLTISGLQPGL